MYNACEGFVYTCERAMCIMRVKYLSMRVKDFVKEVCMKCRCMCMRVRGFCTHVTCVYIRVEGLCMCVKDILHTYPPFVYPNRIYVWGICECV